MKKNIKKKEEVVQPKHRTFSIPLPLACSPENQRDYTEHKQNTSISHSSYLPRCKGLKKEAKFLKTLINSPARAMLVPE